MPTLTGVIFDHSSILLHNPDPNLLDEIKRLLGLIKSHRLTFTVFSTHAQPINERLATFGLPPADLIVTEVDVGKRKGSPEWIREAARKLGTEPYQLLMVGDDARDWRSAINAATVYIHAHWAEEMPEGVTALYTGSPIAVWRFISHLLLNPPRWEYSLDLPDLNLYVRSLLGSNVRLPASETDPPTNPPSFTLQDIFTYETKAKVGPNPARDLLMLHALSSLYLEGHIEPSSYFAVYPSSTPGRVSPQLHEYLQPAAKLFHGYFKDTLLIRARKAVDSSREKVAAKRENRPPNIPEGNQTNTVHVHPDYRNKLRDRTVIVFDDFTTTGQSVEWARNLLYAAGAGKVILLTIGKYPKPYVVHDVRPGRIITPFQRRDYVVPEVFEKTEIVLTRHAWALALIKKSFAHWIKGEPFPHSLPRQ